jgi:carboxymethylenebutenolidase
MLFGTVAATALGFVDVWNSFRTDDPSGLVAGVTSYAAGGGDLIHAYVARPEGPGRYPGLVLVHHMPGWDELYREMARRLADHGYTVLTPDLYCRVGHGTPDDVYAAARARGGLVDDQVVADCTAARDWLRSLPTANGRVGIMGSCSGGRHALLTASRSGGFDAVADLWGGGVVAEPDTATPQRPVAPIEYTADLAARCSGCSATTTAGPARPRSTPTRPSCAGTPRRTSSTATTAPATGSSTTTGRFTGRRRRWTAGRSCSPSSATSCPSGKEQHMCTNISRTERVDGAAKGGAGWFPVSTASVGFDHATGTRFEHALLIDFIDPSRGPSARVGVEVDLGSGRALVAALQEVIEAAERSGAPV